MSTAAKMLCSMRSSKTSPDVFIATMESCGVDAFRAPRDRTSAISSSFFTLKARWGMYSVDSIGFRRYLVMRGVVMARISRSRRIMLSSKCCSSYGLERSTYGRPASTVNGPNQRVSSELYASITTGSIRSGVLCRLLYMNSRRHVSWTESCVLTRSMYPFVKKTIVIALLLIPSSVTCRVWWSRLTPVWYHVTMPLLFNQSFTRNTRARLSWPSPSGPQS